MKIDDDSQPIHLKEGHGEVDELTKIKYFGGSEYDGIKELDNPLPPWLKYIFYITIIISASYLTLVFVFHDDDIIQQKEYSKEMAAARAKTAIAIKDETVRAAAKPLTQEEMVAAGKIVFNRNCTVCHGKFGEGLVGPNFTDEYWIHGNKTEDMLKVINEGVIEKGMISFKSQLNRTQINNVISYIQSLQGTNPANPKAPQGVKFVKG